MKRIAILAALLISISAFSQEKPLTTSAVIDFNSGDMVSAKKHIDEASDVIGTKDPSEIKPKVLIKFYHYKGLINYAVYSSKDPAIKALDAEALDKAADGFIKNIELETKSGKDKYSDESKRRLQYVANDYARIGIEASGSQDYATAYTMFLKTYNMKKMPAIGITDSSMLYNASIMAQEGKMYDKAILHIQELIDMGYRGVKYTAVSAENGEETEFSNKKDMKRAVASGKFKDAKVEGDARPQLYLGIANLHLTQGDTIKYNDLVVKGREKFPEDAPLIMAELQRFLDKEEYDKAMVNLDLAINKFPDNKILYFNKGLILQTKFKETDKAQVEYDKAIAIDSNYTDPIYMSGIIYVDKANATSDEINKLKLNEKTKFNQLKKRQEGEFKKALVYFEKVYKVKKDDQENLSALKEVYYKLGRYKEAQEIQAQIK